MLAATAAAKQQIIVVSQYYNRSTPQRNQPRLERTGSGRNSRPGQALFPMPRSPAKKGPDEDQGHATPFMGAGPDAEEVSCVWQAWDSTPDLDLPQWHASLTPPRLHPMPARQKAG